jgi:hypothetical protein
MTIVQDILLRCLQDVQWDYEALAIAEPAYQLPGSLAVW